MSVRPRSRRVQLLPIRFRPARSGRPRSARLVQVTLAAMLAVSTTSCGGASDEPTDAVAPAFRTEPVGDDADDPAIWLSDDEPCTGLIIGTNKVRAPDGAVAVYDLDGRTVQTIAGIDRPNNVDVEYGWRDAGVERDIAVVTERLASRVRVFEITGDDQPLVDIGGFDVFDGQTGLAAEPMGIGTYRRLADGAVFVIVSPKEGGTVEHLWQYRLETDDAGQATGSLVRRFGDRGDGTAASVPDGGEVEAIVVDDERGYVYYADERYGIRKWQADPDHVDAATEIAVFGRSGYVGDREGLAIYAEDGQAGYIASIDQRPGESTLILYPRSGSADDPHDHPSVASVRVVADTTDGIEVTSSPLPGLPSGALIAMDSERQAFAVFDWRSLIEQTDLTEPTRTGESESVGCDLTR